MTITIPVPSIAQIAAGLLALWLLGVWYFKRKDQSGFFFSTPHWWPWAWPAILLLIFVGDKRR